MAILGEANTAGKGDEAIKVGKARTGKAKRAGQGEANKAGKLDQSLASSRELNRIFKKSKGSKRYTPCDWYEIFDQKNERLRYNTSN